MARSRERAVAGVTTGRIGLGEEVTWRAWHFGVPFTMTSRITELEAPELFVDEQVRGPFRSFRHEHAFIPGADGDSTIMIDHVVFDAPLGGLGRLSEGALGPYLAAADPASQRLPAGRDCAIAAGVLTRGDPCSGVIAERAFRSSIGA